VVNGRGAAVSVEDDDVPVALPDDDDPEDSPDIR